MYLPKHFEVSDVEALRLIDAEPFATLVAQDAGSPFVSHLPLVMAKDEPTRLYGHMARRNHQWEVFRSEPSVLAIFHGPHTYVTPTWYVAHDVPTWNYAVVHVEGKVRLLEQPRDLVRLLAIMTEKFEGKGPDAWRFRLPDDLAGEGVLAQAIVGFEIVVEKVTAKFKLSQNRVVEDRRNVMDGLAERGDAQSVGVRELMQRFALDK